MSDDAPVLEVRNLRVSFPSRRESAFGRATQLLAVRGVSFDVGAGETLGLVG